MQRIEKQPVIPRLRTPCRQARNTSRAISQSASFIFVDCNFMGFVYLVSVLDWLR